MMDMSNIYKIFAVSVFVLMTSACGNEYDDLPPKTDASVQYALPYAEKPDQDEIAKLKEIRKEHENAVR